MQPPGGDIIAGLLDQAVDNTVIRTVPKIMTGLFNLQRSHEQQRHQGERPGGDVLAELVRARHVMP
ncbi:hypothetical protein BST95_04225 [Halioglobus japonicus]|uniref:hypothetical protein n=1 Tax=Halioglobus japonicus TaxID=930805 RepID=UPI000979404B|nr:hypothetical protein [Halioglobus japonicus]AQA17555.1 hypothetical protein BST95_04225 [Halioglobus japonicus]